MRALISDQELSGAKDAQVGICKFLLGLLELKNQNAAQAAKLFEEALNVFEADYGKSPKDHYNAAKLVMACEYLAKSYALLGNNTKSVQFNSHALTLRTKFPEWAKVSNPETEIFFVVWNFLPFPIDIAPTRNVQ
jgi:tetratricopeptide (TPR) repeat protein